MVSLLLVVSYFTTPINTATAQSQNGDQTNPTTRIPLNEGATIRGRPDPRDWDNILIGVICLSCKENNCTCEETPSYWHLQYSGSIAQVQGIHITFINKTSATTFDWNQTMGYSRNRTTGDECWIITAPAQYTINFDDVENNYALVRMGNNTGGIFTAEYEAGIISCFCVPEYTWGGLVAIVACFAALGMFYMVKNRGNIRQLKT